MWRGHYIQYVSWRISDVSSSNLLTMLFVLFRENQYPASAGESTTSPPGVDWCHVAMEIPANLVRREHERGDASDDNQSGAFLQGKSHLHCTSKCYGTVVRETKDPDWL